MSDVITITGITGFGYHGVLNSERENGQEFSVDVQLKVDLHPAASTDNLLKTINYADVADLVHHRIVGEPCNLIERLAEIIAHDILSAFDVLQVEVTVHKPHAPINVPFTDVSVTITRSRA